MNIHLLVLILIALRFIASIPLRRLKTRMAIDMHGSPMSRRELSAHRRALCADKVRGSWQLNLAVSSFAAVAVAATVAALRGESLMWVVAIFEGLLCLGTALPCQHHDNRATSTTD